MAAQTYTYTWTQTRLETIQDQFRYFMTYGSISDNSVDKVVYGVGEKAVRAVGLFACDSSDLKVIEAELKVDWDLSAKLSLSVPSITGGLSGWDGRQAPEIKVAGRRFAQAAERLQVKVRYWVLFTSSILADPAIHQKWCELTGVSYNLGVPDWKRTPQIETDTIMDVRELDVTLRRAGSD